MTAPQQPATPSTQAAGDPQPASQQQGSQQQTGQQPATGQQSPVQQPEPQANGQQGNGQSGDEPLGPPGLKALREEREAREALEKQVKEFEPLKKLVEALGGEPKGGNGESEVEILQQRFEQLERTAAEERQARWRLEVATEKGLTPQQAGRLTGSTREELAADADALLALFPQQATPQQPGTPRPDPTQGARGAGSDIDARIAEAEAKGDIRTSIALKAEKAAKQ